jgi:Na+/melibiose symporter-like transporter
MVIYQVYLRQDASNPLGMLNAARYAQAGTVAALAIAAAVLISTAATHHRIKYLHVPAVQKSTLRETLADCREILADRQLLLIMGAGLLMGLAKGNEDGLSGYEFLHFWALKPQIVGLLVSAAILAAVIALPLARPLGQRLGKRRAMIWLFLVWIVSGATPVALRFAGLFPANGSVALVPVLTAFFVLSATCALTAVIILTSMISDAVDDIAKRTKQRSEGLVFAVYGVLGKWAAGGGAFVAGAIITIVAFPARAVPGTVDPAIVNHMVLLHIPAGVMLNLGAIFLLNRLDRAPKPAVEAETPRPAEAA